MLTKKYDLTIIINTQDREFLSELKASVRIIPLAIERKISLLNDLKALFKLIIILWREKFDLVHTLSPKTGLLGIMAAWLVRVPIRIHTFQGEVWAARQGFLRSLLKTLDKLMARCATHLLVVSRSEKEFLVQQGIAPLKRLEMLANGSICGVDLNRFKPNSIIRSEIRMQYGIDKTDKIILYVGRLIEDKGLLDLADAFVRLASQNLTLHLLVVGPDEEGMREKIKAKCLPVYQRLHFCDYTSNPEHYIVTSNILCLPSYREGFGLVLIEAAAVGIPTVASRIYGISDAVQEGVTGLLFEVGNVDDLVEKLQCLIQDKLLADKLAQAGRLRVQKEFDQELVISEFLKFYERLLPSYIKI